MVSHIITCFLLWLCILPTGKGGKLTPDQKERMNAAFEVSKQHVAFKRIFEQYNYLEQKNTSVLRDYGAKSQKQLRFIDLPKTGTTFAATVVHYCCPGLDEEYVNVLRPFNNVVPKRLFATLCNHECFKMQPRSLNGDPWAHIPFRSGVDSNKTTVAMFRSPQTRLASQLSYMQVLGPNFAITFGLRKLDGQILFRLLSGGYDGELKNLLEQLALTSATAKNETSLPSELGKYVYTLTSAHTHRLTKYDETPFIKRARECVKLSVKYNMPASLLSDLQNMSVSPTSTSEQLRQYLQTPGEVEKFMKCGQRAAALYPGLQGCQTRMILGRNCYDTYTLTLEDVVEAKRRLSEEFLFVGKRKVQHAIFY